MFHSIEISPIHSAKQCERLTTNYHPTYTLSIHHIVNDNNSRISMIHSMEFSPPNKLLNASCSK